ncbi:alpha/beta fold hydrolase [Nocardia terpenica]|uniref:Carboxymuconolactone decarboxylase n=1 Tax=Nocardia terpenica TaxID=455432 RepID=A0A291RTH1_9NOCA|nr:alpha/beta fold hydrolase [Nocardia terpenica]ATL70607.1 carboxymuconolactone decarboxylase [Nocardia terpenica]
MSAVFGRADTGAAHDSIARHEATTLAGPHLMEKVDELAAISPQLHRSLLDGFGGPLAERAIGYRDWALLTLAVLTALGDTDDQLGVYFDAAVRHGATDAEIADVISLALAYAGAPRAVNAARALGGRLADLRTPDLRSAKEIRVRLRDHDTMVWDSGGDGVPMVLIHALSLDHRFWRAVWPHLTGRGRVVAYDIRGHGHARGAPGTTGLDQLATDTIDLLDALHIPAADIYGASYGGAIAQHVALEYPTRVRSLALIATASRSPRALLEARATAAEQQGMQAQVPVSLLRWFLPETIAEDGWAVRYARECVRRDRVADWAAAWRAMARLDIVDRLPEITAPTLVVAGQQDLSATPQDMRRTARGIPGSEYVLLDPGTHMMPLEQPDALAAVLRRFRTSNSVGAR